jgi:hypothetical protein
MQTILHLTSAAPHVKKGETSVAGHNLAVADARELVNETRRRPWEGDATVIHIPSAHRVSEESWNVLLKVLEEPPPYVAFHLYAPSTDSLPRTIKSRSHVVRESLPKENHEDVSRLVRYVENGDALAIIREADRHSDVNETRQQLMALWAWGVTYGDLDIANLSQFYLEYLNRKVSPRVVVKSLLLTLAIRRRERQNKEAEMRGS